MLLDSTFELSSPTQSSASASIDPGRRDQWQEYLAECAAAQPLFRRHRLHVLGGRGNVTLSGIVPSYYDKQLAQEVVRHWDGVQRIDNRIEVAYRD